MYDTVIVGSGAAGLSAAIYASRAELDFVVLEREALGGGQIINTVSVDNYPGLPGTGGFELGQKFEEHAKKLGARIEEASATGIEKKADGTFTVLTSAGNTIPGPSFWQQAPRIRGWACRVKRNWQVPAYPTAQPVTVPFSAAKQPL
jgi:thioredoxin reductase